jgi:hypothetical protein
MLNYIPIYHNTAMGQWGIVLIEEEKLGRPLRSRRITLRGWL